MGMARKLGGAARRSVTESRQLASNGRSGPMAGSLGRGDPQFALNSSAAFAPTAAHTGSITRRTPVAYSANLD